VITDPSTVAWRPTMMLVHPRSNPGLLFLTTSLATPEFELGASNMTIAATRHAHGPIKRCFMLPLQMDNFFRLIFCDFFSIVDPDHHV
jgi:hypothetical protein